MIDEARTLSLGSPTEPHEVRLAALWTANEARFTEVESRILAWRDAGYPTPSGVETFYSTPAAGTLGDEAIDRRLSPAVTGDTFTMMTIQLLVNGRGPGNPEGLGSWSPTTEESVFFDDVATPETERSQEIGLRALAEALDFLAQDPTEPGVGGYGTTDLGALLDMFNISTSVLPLADDLPADDPRAGLRWFPRPADQFDVDAANPGLDGETFSHGSGPVFRMVISLGPDGVRGENILPGGQSGIPGNAHFADQARRWLANETIPMRYLPEEVAEGAVSRERFLPLP